MGSLLRVNGTRIERLALQACRSSLAPELDSSQHASRRPAGFDVLQETFENRIEVARRFPEGHVPQPGQAMTAPFPQIAIGDGIEVIEIYEAIRATVSRRSNSLPP